MSVPYNWNLPVIRLGCILGPSDGLEFLGPDDDLVLRVPYYDELGVKRIHQIKCSTPSVVGDAFLPSSFPILGTVDITMVPEETILAHVAMAGWIKGAAPMPGSTEWLAMFQDEGLVPDFQLAIGTARIYDARPISGIEFEFDIRKKGTSNPTKTIRTDYGTVATYKLQPGEQMRCLAGGLELKHPSFVHNPGAAVPVVLSSSQRSTILATLQDQSLTTGLNNLWM